MADEPSAMDAYDAEEANGSTSKSVSPVQINIESKNELVKERDILFDEVTTAEEVILNHKLLWIIAEKSIRGKFARRN